MSTQYNKIQAPYDAIRKKSIALIEHENVHTAIKPYIHNASVLDLACGSGFYTHDFLKWGARAVVGVDISPVMIHAAQQQQTVPPPSLSNATQQQQQQQHKTPNFILADCSHPTLYPGGPFDIVFGAWLLNYAPNRTALTTMFRNIALNLLPGGHFISVTVPPTSDPSGSINAELGARPPPQGSGALWYEILDEVEDGVFFHVHGETEVGDVDFDCWHLRRAVYEEAAREGGLRGELRWGLTSVPERYFRVKGEGGASLRELESYEAVPNFGVLVVAK